MVILKLVNNHNRLYHIQILFLTFAPNIWLYGRRNEIKAWWETCRSWPTIKPTKQVSDSTQARRRLKWGVQFSQLRGEQRKVYQWCSEKTDACGRIYKRGSLAWICEGQGYGIHPTRRKQLLFMCPMWLEGWVLGLVALWDTVLWWVL